MNDTTFGERVRLLRQRKGRTQEQAAAALGVARITLVAWEKGRRSPRLDDLPRIALVLGCEPLDLVPGAGTVRS